MTSRHRLPIGVNDTISVVGRYLVQDRTQERFVLQGMAFPVAINPQDRFDIDVGWTAVLDQLAHGSPDLNTLRLYDVDCTAALPIQDAMAQFLQQAAHYGIYVIVPFTALAGDGVLDRSAAAPKCYPRKLYDYGMACVNLLASHPNVLAATVGNEVTNSLVGWRAAPCLHAYATDLQRYMRLDTTTTRAIPLLYAAQHSGINNKVPPDESMVLTMNVLSCRTNRGKSTTNIDDSSADDNVIENEGIDAFGINIESWCSSLKTFEYEEDGTTVGSYYSLWQRFRNTTHPTTILPLVFSEIGCPTTLFNKENDHPLKGARDWHQLPVVLHDMSDIMSGFVAYAYDGNPDFRMMNASGGTWNGHEILPSGVDYDNFVEQLDQYHRTSRSVLHHNVSTVTPHRPQNKTTLPTHHRPQCTDVWRAFQQTFDVTLYPMERMPSYVGKPHYTAWIMHVWLPLAAVIAVPFVIMWWVRWRRHHHGCPSKRPRSKQQTQYGAIPML